LLKISGGGTGAPRKCRSYVVGMSDFSHTPCARWRSIGPPLSIFVQVATPQAPEQVPAQYLLSPFAAGPRTLIDVLYDTAARYPEAAAIDDGTVQLTYSELISDIEASVSWLAARGIGRGDRIGIRMPSGSFALYEAILATLAVGAAYVPVDADDPDERAELVFGEAGRPVRHCPATTPGSSSPPDRPARPKASP
jgi:non-ribosomal peptide synthetase component F